MMEYKKHLPVALMCKALNYPRASFHRATCETAREKPVHKLHVSPRKLSDAEEKNILEIMNSYRFCDKAPAEIHAILMDEGHYYCSVRTMYRLLKRNKQNVQRRQKDPQNYAKPELLATKPNELWSWDITKLKGPVKWHYFQLYTILDVYSRFIVGWLIAEHESDELARELIAETILRQEIVPGTLTLHADRGSSMKSNSVAQLLVDLQVKKTHSRPQVSNDNPFSETTFKTLKYRPGFPERFGSIQDARAHCKRFVEWYNAQHRHSGIAMFTPEQVHYKMWIPAFNRRNEVVKKAFEKNPERFVKGISTIPIVPQTVWINKPTNESENKEFTSLTNK